MSERFFERPILNSPYERPSQHWELDDDGQPTNQIIETRRRSDLTTPHARQLAFEPVFQSYDDLLDHCCDAWNKLVDQPWHIMTIGLRDWAHRF